MTGNAPPSSCRLVTTLLDLHQNRGSRVLRLEHGRLKKQFVVMQGALSFSESNAPEDHLAQILVRKGILPLTLLPRVAALMRAQKTADAALLECSELTMTQITEAARDQAVRILASLMSWEAGTLRQFASDAVRRRQFDLGMPLPELVLLGARLAGSEMRIPGALRGLQGFLMPAAPRHPAHEAMFLNPQEAQALSAVPAPLAVSAVLPHISAGAGDGPRLLLRLVLAGFLRLEATQAACGAGGTQAPRPDDDSEALDALLQRFDVASLYEILALPPDAGADRVKEAYHALARRHHPDRYQSDRYSPDLRRKAEAAFTRITGAYATLGDAAARRRYDEERLRKESQVEAALQARTAADLEGRKMAEALCRAAQAAISAGDFDKAAARLQECVLLRPDVARYHYLLGTAQSEIPRLRKQAEQNLLQALELDSTLIESRLGLAKLYMKANLERRAETQLNELLAWDPNHGEARRLLDEIGRQA